MDAIPLEIFFPDIADHLRLQDILACQRVPTFRAAFTRPVVLRYILHRFFAGTFQDEELTDDQRVRDLFVATISSRPWCPGRWISTFIPWRAMWEPPPGTEPLSLTRRSGFNPILGPVPAFELDDNNEIIFPDCDPDIVRYSCDRVAWMDSPTSVVVDDLRNSTWQRYSFDEERRCLVEDQHFYLRGFRGDLFLLTNGQHMIVQNVVSGWRKTYGRPNSFVYRYYLGDGVVVALSSKRRKSTHVYDLIDHGGLTRIDISIADNCGLPLGVFEDDAPSALRREPYMLQEPHVLFHPTERHTFYFFYRYSRRDMELASDDQDCFIFVKVKDGKNVKTTFEWVPRVLSPDPPRAINGRGLYELSTDSASYGQSGKTHFTSVTFDVTTEVCATVRWTCPQVLEDDHYTQLTGVDRDLEKFQLRWEGFAYAMSHVGLHGGYRCSALYASKYWDKQRDDGDGETGLTTTSEAARELRLVWPGEHGFSAPDVPFDSGRFEYWHLTLLQMDSQFAIVVIKGGYYVLSRDQNFKVKFD